MGKILNITGQRFNRLTATGRSGNKNTKGSYLWNFLCDCGVAKELEAYAVTSGHTKSCGCYAKEVAGEHSITHGNSGTNDYHVWKGLVARILDKENENYPNYGGRGLSISPEFVKSMTSFYEHMGAKPDSILSYSVGRIDNDIGYVKGNLRWETRSQQSHNLRKMASNTSGFTGVVWSDFNRPQLYAVARWRSLTGKQMTKCFSVKKCGLLPAFAQACEYRKERIADLNEQGAEYSVSHGL